MPQVSVKQHQRQHQHPQPAGARTSLESGAVGGALAGAPSPMPLLPTPVTASPHHRATITSVRLVPATNYRSPFAAAVAAIADPGHGAAGVHGVTGSSGTPEGKVRRPLQLAISR